MPEKPFEAIKGDDPLLRSQFLSDHHERPPDNFVESAEGGGINNAELADETPEGQRKMDKGLEDIMRSRRPGVISEKELFRW